jgi:hypothetical protein
MRAGWAAAMRVGAGGILQIYTVFQAFPRQAGPSSHKARGTSPRAVPPGQTAPASRRGSGQVPMRPPSFLVTITVAERGRAIAPPAP